MTRYNLFEEIAKHYKMVKTSEHCYNKMIQSGELVDTHYDYGTGHYDLCMFYYFSVSEKAHYCRIWFGTIDDGDYGAWAKRETKDKAIELLEKVRDRFSDMIVCPSNDNLNSMFMDLGIYFSLE